MIRSFSHKGLQELFESGKSRKVRPDQAARILRRLDALDRATEPGDLDLPGFGFHPLRGLPKRFSVMVNGPWRITFEWIDGEPWKIDLEQYHQESAMATRTPSRAPAPTVTLRNRRRPTHPGAILREDVLPELRMTVTEAARLLGISRQTLHKILAESSPITAEMALRLGKFCGNGPGLWLRMQQQVDLWDAERQLSGELKKIPLAKAG